MIKIILIIYLLIGIYLVGYVCYKDGKIKVKDIYYITVGAIIWPIVAIALINEEYGNSVIWERKNEAETKNDLV